MKFWNRAALALAVAALGAGLAQGALTAKKGALITIPGTFEVKAPAKVWAAVTT